MDCIKFDKYENQRRKEESTILQSIYVNSDEHEYIKYWKMLCGCIMLNLTTRTQVDKVRFNLFERYPTTMSLAAADDIELKDIIRHLGMQNRRATTLKKFSEQWIKNFGTFKNPRELYGIGRYVSDSWKIFIDKNYDIMPTDKVLKKYLCAIDEYS